MKTLNLNSMSWIMALAMMFIVSFTSCSEDNEGDGIIVPIFPELKDTNCAANETGEISFEANLDWELSSSAGWCKFVNGEISESTMSGKAGKQTIEIVVSADGQNYNDDAIAEITLKMGEKSQVIYKVKRAKKEYENLVITDEEGNVYDKDHPLTIKGNNAAGSIYTILKAQAESGMEIGFTNPDWLTARINAETGMYEFTFNTTNSDKLNYKYPIEKGKYVLTYTTKDAATAQTDKVRKVEIPLIYEGIQADAIIISPTYMNVTANASGTEITNGTTTSAQLVSTITTLNDEFQSVKFLQTFNGEKYEYDFKGNTDWITATAGTGDNKDKITLTISENESSEEREAIVMVFPKAVYEQIKADLAGNIIDAATSDIKTMYTTNTMATLKQQKKEVQAERVTFKAEYYADTEGQGGKFADMGEQYEDIKVSIIDLKNESNVSSYNVENNNVWKISIPKDFASLFINGTYGPTNLLIEGVGMATGQVVTGEATSSDVNGQAVSFQGYDENWHSMTVSGWGIYFNNPASYAGGYQVVVKGADNKTIALGIIEIAK